MAGLLDLLLALEKRFSAFSRILRGINLSYLSKS
jgi:hypothetical protein